MIMFMPHSPPYVVLTLLSRKNVVLAIYTGAS